MRVYYVVKGVGLLLSFLALYSVLSVSRLCFSFKPNRLLLQCLSISQGDSSANKLLSDDWSLENSTTSNSSNETELDNYNFTTNELEESEKGMDESAFVIQCINVSIADILGYGSSHIYSHISGLNFVCLLMLLHSVYSFGCIANLYASLLPNTVASDAMRNGVSILLWATAAISIKYKEYTWVEGWLNSASGGTHSFIPDFPFHWRIVQVLSMLMPLAVLLEICSNKMLYHNIKITRNCLEYHLVNRGEDTSPISS